MLHKEFSTTMVARKEKGRRHKSQEKRKLQYFFSVPMPHIHHNIEEIKKNIIVYINLKITM